ncbi:MAG: maleylpyruvate isomerase family mycothiol-dependent enzyme [Chloroflexi bacterium]|nr:maleylpyruvate isomerase family mycothiol-dependent enzyme [Chloroflexota bacterium]MDA1173788.1 maleylpyruvate isomerase family mycothiol-dependent enzyme [Chloroflexota bacterium]
MSKEAFRQAGSFFADTVEKISSSQWDESALGVWNVRDLVGHTSASLGRVAEFSKQRADKVDIASAAQHYHVSLAAQGINDAIADRGREAGQELGDEIAATIRTSLNKALTALDAVPDGTIIAYPNGGIKLEHYLETRVLELTVHTLDILAATGIEVEPPREALSCTLHLLADLAVDSGYGGQLALLATGRGVIADRFSVLG